MLLVDFSALRRLWSRLLLLLVDLSALSAGCGAGCLCCWLTSVHSLQVVEPAGGDAALDELLNADVEEVAGKDPLLYLSMLSTIASSTVSAVDY